MSLLINPRSSAGEFTKYSFPSKTMEYMLSGKPVIMYKLDGIPNEYDEYLYYVEGNSAEDMKNSIVDLLEADKFDVFKRAEKSANFVLENKKPSIQAKKILDLIME